MSVRFMITGVPSRKASPMVRASLYVRGSNADDAGQVRSLGHLGVGMVLRCHIGGRGTRLDAGTVGGQLADGGLLSTGLAVLDVHGFGVLLLGGFLVVAVVGHKTQPYCGLFD